jgi:hypothetical protein
MDQWISVGYCLRKQKWNGPAGGLRVVGTVVRCGVELGHNAARGA